MFADLLYSLLKPWSGENRRRWQRYERVTYVELQPLDADLVLAGKAVWGMTRDFSKHGIGLTTPFQLDCTYLKITIREDEYTGVGIIKHVRKISSESERPLYFVGVELIDETGIIPRH